MGEPRARAEPRTGLAAQADAPRLMRGERLGFAALRASRERSNFFRRCMARWRHADLTAAMLAWFSSRRRSTSLGRLRKAGAIWLHKERSAASSRGVLTATQRLHVLRRQ